MLLKTSNKQMKAIIITWFTRIMILSIILVIQKAMAQKNHDFKIPYFDSAQYVFEGELLDIKPTEDGRMAYNVFKVHKVFKGNLKNGTVVILTKNDRSFGLNDRPYAFPKGFIGTIMTKPANDSLPAPKPNTTNEPILEKVTKPTLDYTFNLSSFTYDLNYYDSPKVITGYAYLSPQNKKAAWESDLPAKMAIDDYVKNIRFYDMKAYYQYLRKFLPKFDDFTDTVWRRPQSNPYAVETGEPIPDTMGEYYQKIQKQYEDFYKKLDSIKQRRKNDSKLKKGGSGTEANFSIKNIIYTNSGTKSIEFDIYLKAKNAGKYLDYANLSFDYNENVFGPNVVKNSNITVTKGPLISNNATAYKALSVKDNPNTNDRFGISVVTKSGSQCRREPKPPRIASTKDLTFFFPALIFGGFTPY